MPVAPATQLEANGAASTPRTAACVGLTCIQSSTTTCPDPELMPPPTPSTWSPAGQVTVELLFAELNGLVAATRLMPGTAADADSASPRTAPPRHRSETSSR